MYKRSAGAAALVAGLLFLVFIAGAGAGNVGEAIGDDTVSPSSYTPLGMSTAPVTVVVQVAGKPWAEVQGDAGRNLSQAEKDQIKDSLRTTQAPVAAKVRELGGNVEASFQSAYNGLRISIGKDKLSTLTATPNVVGIHALQTFYPDNTNGVPLVGAPAVWDGLNGLHGEGIKVGIIDTGIDYTHADFNGPGTPGDYTAAHATETMAANPLYFGPAAPRVKGGTDLVGDNYAAGGTPDQRIPHPDPNPLDCNGHGSHVAGTAAGSGVLADGTTYHGAYNANTISSNSWTIGPGVAPKADLYAIRVFGCTGSTNVVIDAIDWAVNNGMDVINMSLGSPFGTADDPSAVASTNAAKAGVIVVASRAERVYHVLACERRRRAQRRCQRSGPVVPRRPARPQHGSVDHLAELERSRRHERDGPAGEGSAEGERHRVARLQLPERVRRRHRLARRHDSRHVRTRRPRGLRTEGGCGRGGDDQQRRGLSSERGAHYGESGHGRGIRRPHPVPRDSREPGARRGEARGRGRRNRDDDQRPDRQSELQGARGLHVRRSPERR